MMPPVGSVMRSVDGEFVSGSGSGDPAVVVVGRLEEQPRHQPALISNGVEARGAAGLPEQPNPSRPSPARSIGSVRAHPAHPASLRRSLSASSEANARAPPENRSSLVTSSAAKCGEGMRTSSMPSFTVIPSQFVFQRVLKTSAAGSAARTSYSAADRYMFVRLTTSGSPTSARIFWPNFSTTSRLVSTRRSRKQVPKMYRSRISTVRRASAGR